MGSLGPQTLSPPIGISHFQIAIIKRSPFREPTRLSGCLEMKKTHHRISCLQSSWLSFICFLSFSPVQHTFLQIKKTLKVC